MKFSDEEKQYILKRHYENATRKQICEELGKGNEPSITQVFKEFDLKSAGRRDKYPVDENYFNKIDNNDKAYWLGLFYADGNIRLGERKNLIQLQLKDKEHIDKFRLALGAINHKIIETIDNRFSKPCYSYRLKIRSKKLAEDLNKWGCVPRKSLILKDFPNIPKEYLNDFIRGYFDGDGSIHTTISGWRIDFAGTKEFLINIRNYLGSSVKIVNVTNKNKIFHFQIMGNQQIYRIMSDLYLNSTKESRLDRKYERYLKLCKLLNKEPVG